MEKNGYIRRDPTKPRAIEIIDDSFNLARRELINVPIVGTVTAGEPILAVENIEGYFPISPEFVHDYILVERTPTATDGEIIVALLEDSVTVKRFFKEDGCFRLQPENDTMEPIIVPADGSLSVVGKVIGLFRIFK